MISMLIIRLIACEIVMVEEPFTFFDFQVLRFGRSGGFGDYRPP